MQGYRGPEHDSHDSTSQAPPPPRAGQPLPIRIGQIDAYLDGQLTSDQVAAFEAEVLRNESLAEELELATRAQSRIDAALGRLYEPPVAAILPATVLDAESAVASEAPRRRRLADAVGIGIAAALILGTFLAGRGFIWYSVERPTERRYLKVVSAQDSPGVAAAYAQELADGFRPLWVCRDNVELAVSFHRSLGQGLVIDLPKYDPTRPDSHDLRPIGLSFGPAISRWTVFFMGRADGKKVIVFADHAGRDRVQRVPLGTYLHRLQLGPLVLYEVSPLSKPMFIQHFRAINVPTSWLPEVEID